MAGLRSTTAVERERVRGKREERVNRGTALHRLTCLLCAAAHLNRTKDEGGRGRGPVNTKADDFGGTTAV